MNTPPDAPDLVQRQERALLQLIAADRDRQCAQALDDARQRADALLAQARAEARARLRQSFGEQRLRRQERLAAGRARLATQRRLHDQRQIGMLLQRAWAQLPDELLALWQQPASRQRWVRQVLAAARARLPAGGWLVRHAADWPADEAAALLAEAAPTGEPPRCVADAALRAGLQVLAGGNLIDGTLDGLLAERADFESRLLRLLETAP